MVKTLRYRQLEELKTTCTKIAPHNSSLKILHWYTSYLPFGRRAGGRDAGPGKSRRWSGAKNGSHLRGGGGGRAAHGGGRDGEGWCPGRMRGEARALDPAPSSGQSETSGCRTAPQRSSWKRSRPSFAPIFFFSLSLSSCQLVNIYLIGRRMGGRGGEDN